MKKLVIFCQKAQKMRFFQQFFNNLVLTIEIFPIFVAN